MEFLSENLAKNLVNDLFVNMKLTKSEIETLILGILIGTPIGVFFAIEEYGLMAIWILFWIFIFFLWKPRREISFWD